MVLDTSMASMNTKRVDLGHFYGSQDTYSDPLLSNPKKDLMRKLYQSKKQEIDSHHTSLAHHH